MELIKLERGELTIVDEAVASLQELIRYNIEFNKKVEQLKGELLQAMEEHGVKSFDHPLLKAVYVSPTTRKTVDTKRLREEYPWIAVELEKESAVKSSVRLTIK